MVGFAGVMLVSPILAAPATGDEDVAPSGPVFSRTAAERAAPETWIVPSSRVSASVSKEELEDLQFMADDEGISLEEAKARWAWSDEFNLAMTEIRDAYPDGFTVAEARAGDGYEAWVGFKGDAPSDLAERLATLSVPVQVREHMGWNRAEMQTAVEKVHNGVRKETGPGVPMTTVPDHGTGDIVASVGSSEDASPKSVQSRIADALEDGGSLANVIADVPDTFGITITIDPEMKTQPSVSGAAP